jgi:hypothetical protein
MTVNALSEINVKEYKKDNKDFVELTMVKPLKYTLKMEIVSIDKNEFQFKLEKDERTYNCSVSYETFLNILKGGNVLSFYEYMIYDIISKHDLKVKVHILPFQEEEGFNGYVEKNVYGKVFYLKGTDDDYPLEDGFVEDPDNGEITPISLFEIEYCEDDPNAVLFNRALYLYHNYNFFHLLVKKDVDKEFFSKLEVEVFLYKGAVFSRTIKNGLEERIFCVERDGKLILITENDEIIEDYKTLINANIFSEMRLKPLL